MRKRLELPARQAATMAEEEKKRFKELHYSHCPKCGNRLEEAIMEKVGVEICPSCHAVWLDDGELAELTETKSGVLLSPRGLFRSAPAPVQPRWREPLTTEALPSKI